MGVAFYCQRRRNGFRRMLMKAFTFLLEEIGCVDLMVIFTVPHVRGISS